MKRRELSDDIIEALEATPRKTVELLERFNVGECWEKEFLYVHGYNVQDTTPIMKYVERLKLEGLDIGKGNAQFGYKMPLPKKNAAVRYLQIFRRR